ncbi:MAG: hypothetical protein IK954_01305 [Clostridia bacterium]|nr:hypothetical protein [Clostridia bacterium]
MKKLIALFLVITLSLCLFTACDPDAEEIDWANIKLGHVLPEPQSNLMKIVSNDDDNLLVYIHKVSENDYLEYQRWCEKDKGFNIETESIGSSFYAYNQDGYYLSLYYSDSQDEMHITLDAPIPMEDFELPEYAVAAGLPIPSSSKGHFNWQNTDSFFLYVGETSKEDYMLYKDACVAAGFTGDPYEYNTVYSATNAKGYKVSLNYKGFNIFTLEFHGPDGSGGNNTESNDPDNNTSEYTLDYTDAASFESALNDGAKVKGKIVQFDVVEYKPDSAMGINCWSGEHLNFISESALDVNKGDIIIGRITEEPSKVLGSWKVPYEPLIIGGEKVEADTNKEPDNDETTESKTVVMSADANSYIGKNPQNVANELKGLGFENIKLVESVTTDTNKTDGVVESVTVAAAGFSKGDSFEKNAEVVITYWKVEEPASEYEKAYIRDMSSYDLYYMFDTDNKTVVNFGTNDTYIQKGTYTGDFSSGITITWSHGQWTEKFTHKSGNSATLIDGSGWDWEYKVCDVADAQEILDGLK